MKKFGINFVYTHNYGCEPGTHLSFTEILRAADDTGMLVAFSQPHFGQYDWRAPRRRSEQRLRPRRRLFTCARPGSHPSVVMYSTSHNATGYVEGNNPGHDRRYPGPSARLVRRTMRSRRCGPRRSSNGSIPAGSSTITRRATWARSTRSISTPTSPRSRKWTTGSATGRRRESSRCSHASSPFRSPGTGRCTADGIAAGASSAAPRFPGSIAWPSGTPQFLGDRAFQISKAEKENLRWEARKFREGGGWHRWDFPHQVGDVELDEQFPVIATVRHRQLAGVPHLGALGEQSVAILRLLEAAPGVHQRTQSVSRGLGKAPAPRLQPRLLRASLSRTWSPPTSFRTGSPMRRARPSCATTCLCWPTSRASQPPSPARTTTSPRARPWRSSSSSSTTRDGQSRPIAGGP